MHFVLVVPPISATGDETYYFWVLQKWLHEKREEDTSIILPPPYIQALKEVNTRWEFSEDSCNFNQYLPSTDIRENTEIILHQLSMRDESEDCPPPAKFVDLIMQEQSALIEFYVSALQSIKTRTGDQVAVVTWLNNASLRVAANRTDCKLVFNELGPFRKPYYRPTAYWDRHGVNGETEVADRWQKEKEEFLSWKQSTYPQGGSLTAIRELLANPKSHTSLSMGRKRAEIGVVLQVETDSNALAYGGGWSNLTLVDYVNRSGHADDALLRLHPGGAAIYPGLIDLSPSPLEFLASVGEVWTVNSSLGIEALFWGKQVRILGESPIKLMLEILPEEREDFLAWFFLCYLISFDLLFDAEYYTWRLENPNAGEIAERHISSYLAGPKLKWQSIPFPPEADANKLTVNFPSPRLAPITLATQNFDLEEQKGYIRTMEKDIQALYPIVSERDALLVERDSLIRQREELFVQQEELVAKREELAFQRDVLTAERDIASSELTSIKRSRVFRLLKRIRFM